MTLCIAALALRRDPVTHRPRPCAILSYDRRIEGPGAYETAFKHRRLSSHWHALYAGTVPYATELLSRFAAYLREHESELTEANVIDRLYIPIHEQVRIRAERLAADSGGLWDVSTAQQALRINEELLLTGWLGDRFRIYRYFYPEWQECDPYAAIGFGTWVAEAMLGARETTSLRFAPETIYRVYEAQRMGSMVPSVGSNAAMLMLTHEGGVVQARDIRSDEMLKQLWSRFGFRSLTVDFNEADFAWGEPY